MIGGDGGARGDMSGHVAPLGRILEVLGDRVARREAGGYLARCPAHDDRTPSLRVAEGRDGVVLVRCRAGCATPDVLAAIGLSLGDLFPRRRAASSRRETSRASEPSWSPEDARRTWLLAHGRARDDAEIDADRDAYRYLASRGLAAAWEEGACGILHPDLEPHLPPAVRWWPREGYRVVVPLVDQASELVEVQARYIGSDPNRKKILFPKGGSGRGRMFASRGARELLVGCGDHPVVLLGEGLTDYLALVVASPVPAVAVAGVATAATAIGEWVRGRHVVVVLDCDDAGERAIQDVADAVYAAGGAAPRLEWPRGCVDACDALATRGDGGLADMLDRATEEARRTNGS